MVTLFRTARRRVSKEQILHRPKRNVLFQDNLCNVCFRVSRVRKATQPHQRLPPALWSKSKHHPIPYIYNYIEALLHVAVNVHCSPRVMMMGFDPATSCIPLWCLSYWAIGILCRFSCISSHPFIIRMHFEWPELIRSVLNHIFIRLRPWSTDMSKAPHLGE